MSYGGAILFEWEQLETTTKKKPTHALSPTTASPRAVSPLNTPLDMEIDLLHSQPATVFHGAVTPVADHKEKMHDVFMMGSLEDPSDRSSYWSRRLRMWDRRSSDTGHHGHRHRECVSVLPLVHQVTFRRKMLSVLVAQLVMITLVMTLFTYHPTVQQLMVSTFRENPWYLVITFGVTLVSFAGLYFGKIAAPYNWIVLALFSVILSLFLSSFQQYLETNAGMFCSAFMLVTVVILLSLSGIRRQNRDGHEVLLSSFAAGIIAFIVVAAVVVGSHFLLNIQFLSTKALAYSLILELVLVIWFAYDAGKMYSLLRPDEYMNGVVYFYTDLVLLSAMALVFSAMALMCVAGPMEGMQYLGFVFLGWCPRWRATPNEDEDAMDMENGRDGGNAHAQHEPVLW